MVPGFEAVCNHLIIRFGAKVGLFLPKVAGKSLFIEVGAGLCFVPSHEPLFIGQLTVIGVGEAGNISKIGQIGAGFAIFGKLSSGVEFFPEATS